MQLAGERRTEIIIETLTFEGIPGVELVLLLLVFPFFDKYRFSTIYFSLIYIV